MAADNAILKLLDTYEDFLEKIANHNLVDTDLPVVVAQSENFTYLLPAKNQIGHMFWMVAELKANFFSHQIDIRKMASWLGFIDSAIVTRGWTSVNQIRNLTRSLWADISSGFGLSVITTEEIVVKPEEPTGKTDQSTAGKIRNLVDQLNTLSAIAVSEGLRLELMQDTVTHQVMGGEESEISIFKVRLWKEI